LVINITDMCKQIICQMSDPYFEGHYNQDVTYCYIPMTCLLF
jgi:hypothetical protein